MVLIFMILFTENEQGNYFLILIKINFIYSSKNDSIKMQLNNRDF